MSKGPRKRPKVHPAPHSPLPVLIKGCLPEHASLVDHLPFLRQPLFKTKTKEKIQNLPKEPSWTHCKEAQVPLSLASSNSCLRKQSKSFKHSSRFEWDKNCAKLCQRTRKTLVAALARGIQVSCQNKCGGTGKSPPQKLSVLKV